jgi:hypothetical protein
MTERYEKLGTSVRLESSVRGRSVITLREGGFAEANEDGIACGPLPPDPAMEPPAIALTGSLDETVRRMARGFAVVERLTLVEGSAAHRFVSGTTRRQWIDGSGRLFVALVRQPCGRRAALSLGADSLRAIDPAPVASVCQALALTETLAPSHAPSLTLEPWVAASLVRAMADEGALPGRGLRFAQDPPPDARDGRGGRLRKRIVRQSTQEWPDTFRPSYRFAPVPVPLHVDLEGPQDDDRGFDYIAVALASSWVHRGGAFHARLWIVDREAGRVSFARTVVDPRAMTRTSVHAEGERVWFPDGAGAWGRRLTLSQPAALVRSA